MSIPGFGTRRGVFAAAGGMFGQQQQLGLAQPQYVRVAGYPDAACICYGGQVVAKCPVHSASLQQQGLVEVAAYEETTELCCMHPRMCGMEDGRRILALLFAYLLVTGMLLFVFLALNVLGSPYFQTDGEFILFGAVVNNVNLYVWTCVFFGFMAATYRMLYYVIEVPRVGLVMGTWRSQGWWHERLINTVYNNWYLLYWFLFANGATSNIMFFVAIGIGWNLGDTLFYAPSEEERFEKKRA